jgi:hypothetical protein
LRVFVEIMPVGELDTDFRECGCDVFRERRREARDLFFDACADRAELLDLVESVGRGRPQTNRDLFLQSCDANLEELVDVAAVYRKELGPLEHRQRRVLGVGEHARLEVEHRKLAVQKASCVGRCVNVRNTHDVMVGARRQGCPGRSPECLRR